jgi:hypothetical protein
MLTNSGIAFQKLPFMQDPNHFLRSHFWGCDQGYKLSVRCKHQLELSLPSDPETQTSRSYVQSFGEIMDSILDCYVHTQICPRCVSLEKVTCQQGYRLMEARDSASDAAARMGIIDGSLDVDLIESMSQEQIEASFNKTFTQEKFLYHKNSCEVCTSKQPKGRYSISVWNIEVARSQRLD